MYGYKPVTNVAQVIYYSINNLILAKQGKLQGILCFHFLIVGIVNGAFHLQISTATKRIHLRRRWNENRLIRRRFDKRLFNRDVNIRYRFLRVNVKDFFRHVPRIVLCTINDLILSRIFCKKASPVVFHGKLLPTSVNVINKNVRFQLRVKRVFCCKRKNRKVFSYFRNRQRL